MLGRTVVQFSILLLIAATGCAGKKQPLDRFAEDQAPRIHEKAAYIQADFDFWAAVYQPTTDDLQTLRSAWIEHGEAFPESKGFFEVENAVQKGSQNVLVVALFTTAFENADLTDKAQGWTVSPVPQRLSELPEGDQVLKTLMPVRNNWARYFILTYGAQSLQDAPDVVIGNRTSRVRIPLR